MPPRTTTLPFSSWPAADQTAWTNLVTPSSPLEDGGELLRLSPATRAMVKNTCGGWLLWLKTEGVLIDDLPPVARLTRDRVLAYLRHLEERELSTGSLYLAVHNLEILARALGPMEDWTWLRTLKNKLQRSYRPPDKRHKVVPVEELYALGLSLMTDARESTARYPVHYLTRYRDGLLIALLAATALRLKNLTALDIDRHVHIQPDGIRIVVPAHEVKTRRSLSIPLPRSLKAPFLHYLNVIRPRLLGDIRHDRLWVTKDGAPMPDGAVAKQIKHWTRKKLGRAINPHLFRDCVATSLAHGDADGIRTAQGVLGHTTSATTETHYIQAAQERALTRHQEILRQVRRSARPLSQGSPS
jgi:site-specific recombinase XerD